MLLHKNLEPLDAVSDSAELSRIPEPEYGSKLPGQTERFRARPSSRFGGTPTGWGPAPA
jgi:hypothetical protein